MLTCKLCLSEPRLELPLCYAPLMVFHAVIDHGGPIERIKRIHRMVLPSGETIWGLGSLDRKRPHVAVWRVRTKVGGGKAQGRTRPAGVSRGGHS